MTDAGTAEPPTVPKGWWEDPNYRRTWIGQSDAPSPTPWTRYDLGTGIGIILLSIGLIGLTITLLYWASQETGFPPCISGCTYVELDVDTAVLVISGILASLTLSALGSMFVFLSRLLLPRDADATH